MDWTVAEEIWLVQVTAGYRVAGLGDGVDLLDQFMRASIVHLTIALGVVIVSGDELFRRVDCCPPGNSFRAARFWSPSRIFVRGFGEVVPG